LKPIEKEDLIQLINTSLQEDLVLKSKNIQIKEYEALLRLSGGDARKLLNLLELVSNSEELQSKAVDNELVLKLVQQNLALYDKSGEQHYDIISAFIKSIRSEEHTSELQSRENLVCRLLR